MRNRNWDQDFDRINQANVNRMHVNRDGQRQYDSGYRNPMGMTSFEQNMQPQSHGRNQRQNPDWVNTSPDRYHPQGNERHYAPNHRHARVDYDERQHLHHRHPDENATNRGFMDRIGERVGEFWHHGRERMEHMFDRFGNRHENHDRGNYNRPFNHQFQQDHNLSQPRNNRQGNFPNRHPREGFQNSPYDQGNQGFVQGNRYQPTDYSARSSYRLLDTYSGYGQSGGSYASDRDED